MVNSAMLQGAGSPSKNFASLRVEMIDESPGAFGYDTESDLSYHERKMWDLMVNNEDVLARLIPMPNHLITAE